MQKALFCAKARPPKKLGLRILDFDVVYGYVEP